MCVCEIRNCRLNEPRKATTRGAAAGGEAGGAATALKIHWPPAEAEAESDYESEYGARPLPNCVQLSGHVSWSRFAIDFHFPHVGRLRSHVGMSMPR